MFNNNKRRLISAFLSLIFIFSLISCDLQYVFASDEKQDTSVSVPTEENNNAETQSKKESPTLKPIFIEEIVEKREEATKYYSCDDGSCASVTFSVPVHCSDDGETWVDIDKQVESDKEISRLNTEKNGISWTASANFNTEKNIDINYSNKTEKRNTTESNYSRSDVASLKEAVSEVLTTSNTEKLKNVECLKDYTFFSNQDLIDKANEIISEYNSYVIGKSVQNNSTTEYIGAFGEGTVMQYIKGIGGIKENLILTQKTDFVSYSVQMNAHGLKAVYGEDNHIDFVDEKGNIIIVMSPPLMYDDAGSMSFNIDVKLDQNGDEISIDFIPDENWLNSEERVYPIVIDPTYSEYQNKNTFEQTFVSSHYPNGIFNNYWFMCYGYGNQPKRDFWTSYSYFWFKTFPYMASNYIYNSEVVLTVASGTTTIHNIDVYIPEDSWTPGTLTWNNKPAFGHLFRENLGYSYDSTAERYRYTVNMDVLPVNWINNEAARRFGLMIKYHDEITDDYNLIYAANSANGATDMPYLILYYHPIPTVPSSTSVDLNTGIYYIQNAYYCNYLTHNSNTNTVDIDDFNGGSNQQWYIEKQVAQNGNYYIYTFTPLYEEDYRMEVHCGNYINYRPVTVYDYVTNNNLSSSHIKFKICDLGNSTYSINPINNPGFALTAYYGAQGNNTSMYFYNQYNDSYREFERDADQNTMLFHFSGSAYQQWRFITAPITLTNSSEVILEDDTIDLDNIGIVYPGTITYANWSIVGDCNIGTFNNSTNEFHAFHPGKVIFKVVTNIGYARFTLLIEQRFEYGGYYIKNISTGQLLTRTGDSIGNNVVLQNAEYSSNQLWFVYRKKNMSCFGYLFYLPEMKNNLIDSDLHGEFFDTKNSMFILSNGGDDDQGCFYTKKTQQSNRFNLVLKNNNALSCESNNSGGYDLLIESYDSTSQSQRWEIIKAENQGAVAAIDLSNSVTPFIDHFSSKYDYKWYKVTVPANSGYLKINFETPKLYLTNSGSLEYFNTVIYVYSGISNNPLTLKAVAATLSNGNIFFSLNEIPTVDTDYYIKVSCTDINNTVDYIDFSSGDNTDYKLSYELSQTNLGNEAIGWIHKEDSITAPIKLYFDDSMNQVVGSGANSFTYYTAALAAMQNWNSISGNTLFVEVTTEGDANIKVYYDLYNNYFSDDSVQAFYGTHPNNNNELCVMINNLSDKTQYEITQTITHELGHALGFRDLYIASNYNIEYNGAIINNQSHIMFGITNNYKYINYIEVYVLNTYFLN